MLLEKNRHVLAHRVAAHFWLGLDLSDTATHVCHRCDNPSCCNPKHLYLGSDATNRQDAWDRGRFKGTSKLTDEQVREIRRTRGVRLQRDLADEFGVSVNCISECARGLTYKHIR